VGQKQAVMLGKDEASQRFVFRVWHACSDHSVYYSRYSGEELHQMEKHQFLGNFRMFFLVTSKHLALAKRLSIIWYDRENGGPGADIVRPYGNSGLISDIAEIIGYPLPEGDACFSAAAEHYLEGLHRDMHIVLQIILHTRQVKAGVYKKPSLTDDWVAVSYLQKEDELVLTESDTDIPQPGYRLF
jgi:hypothetical protein